MPEGGTAYRRLNRDERREQILVAARRLYAEHGAAAVSTSAVAREAGVTRGLLHHHFGTKRDLELEVIRSMLRYPPGPLPHAGEVDWLDISIERWLTMLERHREPWLLAQGMGSDPEVQAILETAREDFVDRLAAALGRPPTPELRALLRAWSSFAEAASLEWLVRERLDREGLRILLQRGLTTLVSTVLPAVEARHEERP